jgi:hypothetical protein
LFDRRWWRPREGLVFVLLPFIAVELAPATPGHHPATR